jgi:tetratricopeptide (TPR) repeat protein
MKGDTVAAQAQMNTMMERPDSFSASALFEAAGAAFTAENYPNAIKLYEVGLGKNPMFRDGLFSYISALIKAEQFDKATAAARKLISIDPNSQGSLQQTAAAWQGLMKSTQDSLVRLRATDSTLHYVTESRTAPAYLKVNAFDASAGSIDGQINNMTDAPKSFEVSFEFLDASGGVVSTAKVPVADIPAKTGKAFSVKGTGTGIVAWRYAPLK